MGGEAVVARGRRRAPRVPRDGGALRRVVVREARRRRRGRRRLPRAPLRQPCRPRDGPRDVHTDAQPARRDRVRLHGDPSRRRAVPHRHRYGVRSARRGVDPPACALRRLGAGRRRDLGVRLPWALGAREPRDPPAAHGHRPRERGLLLHGRTGAGGRARAVPRRARHLRRRARLGALLPDRVRRATLGRALGRRTGPRPRRGRLQGDRLAAAREGLPRLGGRHLAGGHAVRSRAWLRGQARQGRLRRPRRARLGRGAGPPTALPHARRPTRRGARLRARPRRRRSRGAGHERGIRLHGGRVHRLCVPSGGARRRHRGGGRDLRRVGRRRRGRGAALRPDGREDPRMSEALAEAVARVWPDGRSTWEVLGGGITNHNVKVTRPDGVVVLRVAGKDTDLLGIDRTVELAATRAAAEVGVGPEVVDFVEPEGWLVTRFVEGSNPPPERLREPEQLRRVARALRAFHHGPAIPGRFDGLEIVEAYRDTAVERGAVVPDAFAPAHELARRIAELRADQPPRACHNDLLNANFIDDGERLVIVDWEYAGMGDPFFDLANFSINHELDAEGRGAPR